MSTVGLDDPPRKKFPVISGDSLAIIVPVYNGIADLRRCLTSIERCRPNAEILLYDDASTDPAVALELARFASACPGARVLGASANAGFITSCNSAAATTAPGSHLLFLNSDTELTQGAVEEMMAVMEETGAAACCPLSSNATFLSIPKYQQANELPAGWTAEDMARCWREAVGERRALAIPTPVGFCMLVRRDAWDRWGPFDPAYGAGYGEEDDFGQRVQAAGETIVAATRAYVWHRGGASFGSSPELAARRRLNGELLLSRWPQYAVRTREFCRANPFRDAHERLWHALLCAPEHRADHVLHVVPRWELQGPLRDRVLGLARAARGEANHTILVPTPDRGAWLDAIDFEVERGVRVVGLINLPDTFELFLLASPATQVHLHATGEWDSVAIAKTATRLGRPVRVS